MRLIYTLLVCFLATGAMAQTGKLKHAKQKFDNLDYIGAIELYNEILEDADVASAKINLAESYRKVNDTQNAEFWYGQVVRLPEAEPIHKLYYGQMLQRNGKCDLAREWYQSFVDLVPDDQRGQYLLRACDYEDELMAKGAGLFEVAEVDFNSHSDDFSPQYYKNGIVFSSERDTNPIIRRTHTWTGNPFLELYYVDMKETGGDEASCGNYTFGRPEKFSNEINTKYHDAVVSFSKNGEEIFFTRNNFLDGKKDYDDDGVMRLKVFYARSEGEGEWGELQSLPFNSNEYSVAHPSLSEDGQKLYFASDMPGGFGGFDIYYSEKESGRWGPPLNLGSEVNTEGTEVFPYAGKDGKIYFASDGLIGLGGLDIYTTSQRENGIWQEPENLGYPINTLSDDFGVIFNEEGTCGFFSSNREGGVGNDDIYSLKKIAIPIEVLVYDESTDLPIEGATVVITCKGDTLITDANGKVTFDMKLNDCCNLTASMEDYESNSDEACTNDMSLADNLEIKIPLKKDTEFMLEGIVYDGLSQLPMEGATVTLYDQDSGDSPEDYEVVAEFTTTSTGKYSFEIEKDKCYRVKATMESYFAGIADDVCTKELEESETLVENLYLMPTTTGPYTEEEIKEFTGSEGNTDYTFYDPNQRMHIDKETLLPAEGEYADGKLYRKGVLMDEELNDPGYIPVEDDPFAEPGEDGGVAGGGNTGMGSGGPKAIPYLLHIYYDFNKSNIRADAISELEKLYQLMVDNEQYIIEIGSHTDARGSTYYNVSLSQRRANAVVKWLVNKGIDRSRLVARGYGEKVTVNKCVNNVKCTEKEHQMNRRTEFKVVGCKDCSDTKVISEANPNAKVDKCLNCPF